MGEDPIPETEPNPTPTPDPDPTYYNVLDYGAIGNGITDTTVAINNTINYVSSLGSGTVYIPDGTYMINTSSPIRPKSNVNIVLATNAVLKAIPTANGSYDIVYFYNVSNAGITGGSVLGDRDTHLGTTGEWGYGIRVSSCSYINLANINISHCWGDGVIIGGTLTGHTWSDNVTMTNVVSDNNRRQGLSVISVKGLTITGGNLMNTIGADPQAGIDFEPDLITHFIQGVVMNNVQITNNHGWGVDWWFKNLIGSGNLVTIEINNCTVTGNGTGQIRPLYSYSSYYAYTDITVDGVQVGGI
jgi:polygalacturonase